jgi:hypothetical protein
MKDPIDELGNEQLYLLAADLQVQLEKGTANRPVLFLLMTARAKARGAIKSLVNVDATEIDAIIGFQAEIRLYGDLIDNCQALILRGREADSQIAESERSELAELIGSMSAEDRRLHGFQQQGSDD